MLSPIFLCIVLASILHLSRAETSDEWRTKAIDKHNELRAKHGSPPLKINQELCQQSQKWADNLAKIGRFEHSSGNDFGENIFTSWITAEQKTIDPAKPVQKWYDEVVNYDYVKGDTSNGGEIGHFTQVVWKETTEVCISFASKYDGSKTDFYVVANYKPAGNIIGSYQDNVKLGDKTLLSGGAKAEGATGSVTGNIQMIDFDLHRICYFVAIVGVLLFT